jgi:cell division protein FtsL
MKPNGETHTPNGRDLKQAGIWVVIMGIFILQLLGYTWCRVQCFRVGYEISREAERHRELLAMQNSLRIELARLQSPERIARIARRELELKTPRPDQMVVLP